MAQEAPAAPPPLPSPGPAGEAGRRRRRRAGRAGAGKDGAEKAAAAAGAAARGPRGARLWLELALYLSALPIFLAFVALELGDVASPPGGSGGGGGGGGSYAPLGLAAGGGDSRIARAGNAATEPKAGAGAEPKAGEAAPEVRKAPAGGRAVGGGAQGGGGGGGGTAEAAAAMRNSTLLPTGTVGGAASASPSVPNCLDPEGPKPVILMSLGRSGSASTWQVLGALTGRETKSVEYTGSSREESIRFFTKRVAPNDGGGWIMKYMCRVQRENPGAGIVGFKWKPNRSIGLPAAMEGLKLLGRLSDPSIVLVRSRRNLLDVIISRYKHKRSTERIPAHCQRGDKGCLALQLRAGKGVELPTHKLLGLLETLTREEDEVDEQLEAFGVPHVRVSFEELYYGQDASEWARIVSALGIPPIRELTKESLESIQKHASTSHPSHKRTIRNFEEVANLLDGTKFAHLLHP